MSHPVIVAARRTPVGKFMGSLAKVPAPQLGAFAIEASPRAVQREARRVPSSVASVSYGSRHESGTEMRHGGPPFELHVVVR